MAIIIILLLIGRARARARIRGAARARCVGGTRPICAGAQTCGPDPCIVCFLKKVRQSQSLSTSRSITVESAAHAQVQQKAYEKAH